MKKLAALFIALCLLLGAATLAECPRIDAADYPTPDGSTATLPLSYLLYQRATGLDEATAKDAIHHSKTSESFYELVYGRARLLLVYEPSQDAWDVAKDNDVKLEYKPIGLDAPVFLINDANPVDSMTADQVVDLYAGRITNWKEVGGEDLPIVAYQRIENSGSQVMVEAQVMRGTPMMEAPKEFRPAEMGELIDVIASYRNTADSIGYSVYYYVHNMYMQEGIKLLKIDGVEPTNASIADGSYPWRQPFYAVIRADEPADSPARRLYDWLTTDEGRALIEEAGYVAAPAED